MHFHKLARYRCQFLCHKNLFLHGWKEFRIWTYIWNGQILPCEFLMNGVWWSLFNLVLFNCLTQMIFLYLQIFLSQKISAFILILIMKYWNSDYFRKWLRSLDQIVLFQSAQELVFLFKSQDVWFSVVQMK